MNNLLTVTWTNESSMKIAPTFWRFPAGWLTLEPPMQGQHIVSPKTRQLGERYDVKHHLRNHSPF